MSLSKSTKMITPKEPPPLTDRDIQFQQYFTGLAPNYHYLTSNTTLLVAQKALELAAPPSEPDALIHDNACGPGTASLALISFYKDKGMPIPNIIATDYTPIMIANVSHHENVTASVADSQALPFPDDHFDYTICNISLANFSQPDLALKEIYRTLKPDGTAVITHWKHFALSDLLRKSQERYHGKPQPEPPVAGGQDLMQEGVIADMLVEAGWEKERVVTHAVEVESKEVQGATEFLTGPYLPFARGLQSEEDKERWRNAVREVLEEEGSVKCEGWVVAGRK